MLDTPFLRRIREKGRVEGQTEGLDKGRSEGLREAISDVLVTRLSISVPAYRRLERHLSTFTDFYRLRALHQAAQSPLTSLSLSKPWRAATCHLKIPLDARARLAYLARSNLRLTLAPKKLTMKASNRTRNMAKMIIEVR